MCQEQVWGKSAIPAAIRCRSRHGFCQKSTVISNEWNCARAMAEVWPAGRLIRGAMIPVRRLAPTAAKTAAAFSLCGVCIFLLFTRKKFHENQDLLLVCALPFAGRQRDKQIRLQPIPPTRTIRVFDGGKNHNEIETAGGAIYKNAKVEGGAGRIDGQLHPLGRRTGNRQSQVRRACQRFAATDTDRSTEKGGVGREQMQAAAWWREK